MSAILPNERTNAFLVRRVRLGLGLLLFAVAAFTLADVLFAGAAVRAAANLVEVNLAMTEEDERLGRARELVTQAQGATARALAAGG